MVKHQRVFGYTTEELKVLIAPMARTGAEPIGSMGTDTPVAVLSDRSRLLFDYFQQLFAQVTNPPLDAIREELVTSMGKSVGPEANLLRPGPASCRQVVLPHPILTNEELAKLLYINDDGDMPGFKPFAIDGLYPVAEGGEGLRRALEEVRAKVSDGGGRRRQAHRAVRPALVGRAGADPVAAAHRRRCTTTSSGRRPAPRSASSSSAATPARCTTWRCCLGYGAAAINPYLAFETIEDLIDQGVLTGVTKRKAVRNFVKAGTKGVLKIMSKMGISTVASYTGAQVFEAIGLGHDLVDEYFTGTTSRIGGVGLDVLAEEVAARHRFAYLDRPEEVAHRDLWAGGEYQWRREGEHHLFNPETVFKLQHATRTQALRRLQGVHRAASTTRPSAWPRCAACSSSARACGPPVPIDEVEPVVGDRQALLHRRHELRLDLDGGPPDARHRHEPDRRQVEHRRGRRGRRAAARPRAPQRDQAGGVGPVRRDVGVPHQRRRPADQDGPGRQARRGRPAARRQGVPVDREDPALHAGRRADLAAAAPRHLLDRGPQAAHPRPEELEPVGPRPREARGRGRRRARWRPACRRPRPTSCSSPATTAAPAPARSTRSSTPARRGSSAWPRRSRRCCSTACATASSCRPTAR